AIVGEPTRRDRKAGLSPLSTVAHHFPRFISSYRFLRAAFASSSVSAILWFGGGRPERIVRLLRWVAADGGPMPMGLGLSREAPGRRRRRWGSLWPGSWPLRPWQAVPTE